MNNRGFSALEIIITISISFILTAISVSMFSRLSNNTSLDKDANIVLSYISRARSAAIDSKDALAHGVKFASTTVYIYSGTTYPGTHSESYNLLSGANISSLSLSNRSTSFYFNKLTGTPSATGTVTVSRNGSSKSIIIYATGVSEIQ